MTGGQAIEITIGEETALLEPIGEPQEGSFVVYTAIFSDYDDLPTVEAADPRIRYIAFTDLEIESPPSPWEVRRITPVFVDPQRNARRVKLLPHLFLPRDTTVSVWVDASLHIRALTVESIGILLGSAQIATLKHANRDCIYEEADTVLKVNYDSPSRVMRQMMLYRLKGFPAHFGLHATMMVIRRHFETPCIHFNLEWWNVLSQFSKRDQLAFDYVRWNHRGIDVKTLPLNHFSNQVFTFKLKDGQEHKSKNRIVDEHLSSSLSGANGYSEGQEYRDIYEAASPEFLANVRNISKIIHTCRERPPGGSFHDSGDPRFLHSPPDPRMGAEREVFLRAILGRTRLFEMSFAGGYYTVLALAEAGIAVTAVDCEKTFHGEPCAGYIGHHYPDRFIYAKLEENSLLDIIDEIYFDRYDAVHISAACPADRLAYDLACAVTHGRPDAVLVVTSITDTAARRALAFLVARGLLEPYGDLRTEHAAAYAIVRSSAETRDGNAVAEEIARVVQAAGLSLS